MNTFKCYPNCECYTLIILQLNFYAFIKNLLYPYSLLCHLAALNLEKFVIINKIPEK